MTATQEHPTASGVSLTRGKEDQGSGPQTLLSKRWRYSHQSDARGLIWASLLSGPQEATRADSGSLGSHQAQLTFLTFGDLKLKNDRTQLLADGSEPLRTRPSAGGLRVQPRACSHTLLQAALRTTPVYTILEHWLRTGGLGGAARKERRLLSAPPTRI